MLPVVLPESPLPEPLVPLVLPVVPEPLEAVPDPLVEPAVASVEPELVLPVALLAPLSPELLAIALLREELFADNAIASCCVPEPLRTTSSIEPIFWPSRP